MSAGGSQRSQTPAKKPEDGMDKAMSALLAKFGSK